MLLIVASGTQTFYGKLDGVQVFFFMETSKTLSVQFQKSQADLEYMEKRLRLDFINTTAENGCAAEVIEDDQSSLIQTETSVQLIINLQGCMCLCRRTQPW